ncbi:MAG: polysaccharide biosynthesis tyrosine autokinase [Candidatus Omnitrophica bacterium]|nr:polysaccharide biosynthesis tyrosine autokinase [Candidatus Omnitrophota bacterium]
MDNNKHKLEEALDPQTILTYLFVHKLLFCVIVISFLIGAFVYLKTTTPIFRSTVLLLIEKPSKSSLSDRQDYLSLTLFDDDYYNTQYEILKSKSLAERVVSLLNLSSQNYFQQPGSKPADIFLGLIDIKPIKNSRLVEISIDFPDPVMAAKFANMLATQFVEQNLENMLFMSKEMLKLIPDPTALSQMSEQLKDISKGKINSKIYETFPQIVENPVIQNLKTEQIKLESEIAGLANRYKPKHPKMVALFNQKDIVDTSILKETEKVLLNVKAELTGVMQANNVKIVDYAEVSKYPIKPKVMVTLILSIFSGILLGLVVIILIETSSRTIKDSHIIELSLKIPNIGGIPNIEKKFKIANIYDIQNLISNSFEINESLRMIRTNLTFAMQKSHLNGFVLTGSLPNEGKSFVALSLATAFSNDGKKTILIDGDIRIGGLSNFLSLEKHTGLSDYLTDQTLELSDVLVTLPGSAISIIPAGKHVSNPTELFDTDRMKNTIKILLQKCDMLIIDSPPAYIIADSAVLGKILNQILFVIRYNFASLDIITRCINRFNELNIPVLGGILNGIRSSSFSAHSYYSYGKYHKQYIESSKKNT